MPNNFDRPDFGAMGRNAKRGVLGILIVVGFIFVCLTTITRIDPAHVGIRVKLAGSNRGVQDMPVVTGWVFYNPLTEQIIEFPTSIQNVVWAQSIHEGAPHDESITFSSSEGVNVNADIGAGAIAGALKAAKRPVVISGASCRNRSVIESAANVARALCNSGHPAGLSFITPECNSFGLALMGARPLRDAFSITRNGEAAPLVILENDLYRHHPAQSVDSLLGSATRVVVLDHLENKTTAKADLLLPASTFAESAGTLVSNEGRAQRFFPVFPQPNPEDGDVRGDARESWRWLGDRAWPSLDDVLAAVAKDLPQLAPIVRAAPPAKFRMAGAKIPRESHRSSGLTSITANISVVEPKPLDDPDSALAYSMEGATGQPPGALQPFFWTPGWNSIQAVNKFQSEIGDALRGGDPGVRLFDAHLSRDRSSHPAEYFTAIPAPFTRRESEWLIVPIEHIFGSEELSLQSPPAAQLAPSPYLALNAVDASALHLEGETGNVEIELGGVKQRLPLKVLPDLPAGIAGIPAGLTIARGEELPAWSRIERVP